MKKICLNILFASMVVGLFYACKKPPEPAEESLRISTNAAALNETPGATAEFNITIESAMPRAGVKIAFVVKGESDNIVYYTGPAFDASAKVSKINIFNLPQQKICICTITVTSKNKSTNIATASFRVVYK